MTRAGLLTPSERTVLVLLANGHSPRDIAKSHHLAIGTIRSHQRNANRKLGTRTAVQAAVAALILNEIRPEQILIRARRPA